MSKALIAQWIERLVAVQKVAGSIPAKRTKVLRHRQTSRLGFLLSAQKLQNLPLNFYFSFQYFLR